MFLDISSKFKKIDPRTKSATTGQENQSPSIALQDWSPIGSNVMKVKERRAEPLSRKASATRREDSKIR